MASSRAGRRGIVGALAAGLAALAISAGGATTALGAGCPDIGPITNVTAKHVSCKKAKKVIAGWATGLDLKGFTCTGNSKVTCRKGNAVIKFKA